MQLAGSGSEEQALTMDRFTDDVQTIIELEEEIRLGGKSREGSTWLADRMREIEHRYQSLLRLWPIVPGRGRQRRFNCDGEAVE
ncbi:MAG TPA: hypothetical protein PK867_24090 [Pirellulales bacterium]|nr:hypothetical protein [Pirellulales bacterium]